VKYRAEKAGRRVYPIRRGYRMMCCDCGLVHEMDFRVKDGRIEFRVFRDNRATGQARRKFTTRSKR